MSCRAKCLWSCGYLIYQPSTTCYQIHKPTHIFKSSTRHPWVTGDCHMPHIRIISNIPLSYFESNMPFLHCLCNIPLHFFSTKLTGLMHSCRIFSEYQHKSWNMSRTGVSFSEALLTLVLSPERSDIWLSRYPSGIAPVFGNFCDLCEFHSQYFAC